MSINTKTGRSDAVVRSGIAARLAEIQERADEATDGPWEKDHGKFGTGVVAGRVHTGPDVIGAMWRPADGTFIAHARADVPALANAVESVLDYVARCEESGITMQPGDIRRLIAAALGVTA